MGKVIQYQVVEKHPGWFKAYVQRQGWFGKYWKGLDCHGEEGDYATTEFSVRECERLIEKHKKQQTDPFIPRTVYRETL